MENLELGQTQDESFAEDDEDDDASVVLSDLENEDGIKLNKRERKLLQKSK